MLRLYHDIRRMQEDVREIVDKVRRYDRSLASQMRRSSQAVALGVAEGEGATGGNRRLAYERSLKEARECSAAIDLAVLWRRPWIAADRIRRDPRQREQPAGWPVRALIEVAGGARSAGQGSRDALQAQRGVAVKRACGAGAGFDRSAPAFTCAGGCLGPRAPSPAGCGARRCALARG